MTEHTYRRTMTVLFTLIGAVSGLIVGSLLERRNTELVTTTCRETVAALIIKNELERMECRRGDR